VLLILRTPLKFKLILNLLTLLNQKRNQKLIKMSFDVRTWNKKRYLKTAQIQENLAQEINQILPENLGYKEFAEAVATILKDEYGSQNFGPFMEVLHAKLGIDESVNEVKDDYYPDSPEALSAATAKAKRNLRQT
jgi:hypothetical protein